MCWAMANELQNQEGVPEHPRKLLAVAVRSIQWSYAIFWSISTRQQGLLEWSDGYYNGDIRTRKTMQPMELNAEQMGLQRSEQLRELYESLSVSDTSQHARRPSAALSPEDLTDAEWYYLVCMSFSFNHGQGYLSLSLSLSLSRCGLTCLVSTVLPGRALAKGQPIWISNAPYADGKAFTRSLLAKTLVCFPYWGGVIELGTTELVLEDPSLIQHIKTSFLESPKPICSDQSTSSPLNLDNYEDPVFADLDNEIVDTMVLEKLNFVTECEIQPKSAPQEFPFSLPPYMPKEENKFDQDGLKELNGNVCEELKVGSPNYSLDGCVPNQQTDDSFMLEGINGMASQVQSWPFKDDEFSNCVHGSMNSSDCISQTFMNPEKVLSSPNGEKMNNLRLQECNNTKLSSLDLGTDDCHYSRTLSALFKNSHQLIVSPGFPNGNLGSSFTSWKSRGSMGTQTPQIGMPQKILKKALFEVAWMHGGCSLKSREENSRRDGLWKPERCDIGVSHVLLERRRREKLNDKFQVLRSLVPSISKVDKASILGDTIEYLKELETRVEELESCREFAEFRTRTRRKHPDIVERTSGNYGNDIINGKKPSINKRKACDIDETEPELNKDVPRDSLTADLTVSVIEKEVLIEIRCPWRESLLLDIMDAISNLHLDAYSVQSSTNDGILALTIKSKFTGAAVTSVGMIKQALQRVVSVEVHW
ncbi:hypothetical protein HHK36_032871 [Tetracentron sinense]|uniref:BHLH domain-containing protein n=1 Tax=Tetracentron sinense TaxID=13715 RepID=A0A835CWM6_TETSI|nr:hypothetical protein HHK36_032871 [Tetracentron sinense]